MVIGSSSPHLAHDPSGRDKRILLTGGSDANTGARAELGAIAAAHGIKNAPEPEEEATFGGLDRRTIAVVRNRIILVGDAASSRSPFQATGAGAAILDGARAAMLIGSLDQFGGPLTPEGRQQIEKFEAARHLATDSLAALERKVADRFASVGSVSTR